MKSKILFSFVSRPWRGIPVVTLVLVGLAGVTRAALAQDVPVAWPTNADYPNNREPLMKSQYVKLPLGAVKPQGWLRDQLVVAANGLSGHLDEVWDVAKTSAWKGDLGKNVTPEPCWARFVPRWLEGLVPLAYLLDDPGLKAKADLYFSYILNVQDPATVTPSVQAWSNIGRVLPDYYDATQDPRALSLCRRIIDFDVSMRNSTNSNMVDPVNPRLGMLLSFSWWYYNHTGDPDIPELAGEYARKNVDYFKDYFVDFMDMTACPGYSDKRIRHEHGRHGFDVTQAIQYPVQYYLKCGDDSYANSIFSGMKNLDTYDGQVGGRWNADEWLSGKQPTSGTELCDITELSYSLMKDFEVLGDVRLADRLEQLMFNSFPGTCTPDMWAHQYDQQANQVLVSLANRHWNGGNGDEANIFGFSPNYPCCLANMNSPWPRFVEGLWMATGDRGLVAPAYGPCEVKAKVADGLEVDIREETAYPFSDQVRFVVNSSQPAVFPLYFRIPTWSDQAELSVSGEGQTRHPAKGEIFKVERQWHPGDVVTLDFHNQVRTETRLNNSVSIARGPLYFVLRIGEAFKPIQIPDDRPVKTDKPNGRVDWRIDPTTDWNYALDIDREHPQYSLTTNNISACPFAQKGEPVWNPNSLRYETWTEDVPMILKVKARKVPQWVMDGASAGPTPASPVKVATDETTVELIPYGCSRLRISEFPTVQN